MNSDMMVDENPMEDVGKTMPTDEFHDRFDEGRDPGLSFYRHESTQQFDLEEVIAQALPRDGSAMDRDTEREGMPLETVIPYDFDPMRDTIIVDIPRGYGAASGKTMEIKCHRFKPGAAVAIPVPKFTSDAARAGDLNAGPSTVSGSDSRASLSAAEPEQHAPSTSGGESGGKSGADSTVADEDLAAKLAARTKSATRTTTVSQIYAKSFDVDPKAEDFKVEVTLTDEAGRLVAGGESENDDSGHGGTVSGVAAGGDGATSPRARGGKEGAWDPSVEGIWFTDKKVGADRSGDRGRGRETLPAKKKSMDEMQMGVPLDDLDVWTADSPAKKDRNKKKKKSLTWFFGNSVGWGLFGSGGNKKDLTEAALEKMEQSGRVDGPASRRASFDGQRRGSFDGNRRRSGEWQRPDPRSLRDHDSSGSSMKQNSGKSILSLSSGGSIESLKEMLAARQNSFGLVQRADSMTVPNGTGGRAFKVVACQGLTVQDDIWNTLEHEDPLPETLPRRLDSPDQVPGPAQVDSAEVRQTRRSSLDSYSGDEASAGARELRVMPRSDYVRRNDRKDRKEREETSAGVQGGAMRGRRRMARAVDKENVPGVVYLDDMPFAEGGFAKVYRGAFNNDGFSIAVAIKQMTYSLPEGETPDSLEFSRDDVTSHDERTPEARAKDRLRNTARTAAREVEIQQMCSHRMVVSHVMDHTGPSNDDPDTKSERDANIDTSHLGPLTHWKTYIITEFCIGGSLRDILRQPNMVAATKQVRSSAAQLCIAAQVVEGMTYLHSIGVVHNDLKASNVMLHPSGEMHCRWSAKIGDFGIARRMRPGQIRVPMDVMNGTVSHMAPELLQDKHMSRATDVYSFAVLLWEIAAQGESPFSGIDAVDVITAVVKHDLRPKFAENAFRPLIQLATRCWHADPHERPGFDEIGEELITWKPMVTFQRVENVTYMPIREAPESSGADGTTAEGIDDNTVTDASNASSEMPLSTGSVESLEAHARGLRIEERE